MSANNNCDLSDKVAINNDYAIENRYTDNVLYVTDENYLNDTFSNIDEAVRAVCYGAYHYGDDYVWLNAYGNLESGNVKSELPLVEADEMAEYYIENYTYIDHIDAMDEFVDACEYGFDEEDEEEDD